MSLPNPTPPPKPDSALQPDTESLLQPKAKIDWRSSRWRTVRLFSLLVLVSAGLHGVGMLVPLPEKQEVIEKEAVLPEPIQISDLPIEILKEEIPEDAVAPPAEPPPPPPEPEPQIVIQQPVEAPLPAVLPESLLEEPTPAPPLEPIEEAPANDPPENPPPKNPDPKPQEQATRQAYDASGTSSRDGQTGLNDFIISPDFGGAFNLGYEDLKIVSASGGSAPLLSMSYPAEDNSCFEEVSSLSLPVGVAAIVGDFFDDSGQATREIIEAKVVRKTGYAAVDDWIEAVVIGDIDTGTDIYEVIKANSSEPLLEVGAAEELFSFGIIVELPDQPCT